MPIVESCEMVDDNLIQLKYNEETPFIMNQSESSDIFTDSLGRTETDLQIVHLVPSPEDIPSISYIPVKRRFNECGDLCRSRLDTKRVCQSDEKGRYLNLSAPVRRDPMYGNVYPSHHAETFFVFSKKRLRRNQL